MISPKSIVAPDTARRTTALLLVAITLFGGMLRFWKLSQPPLWGDEAATYSRVCGSYQDLIDILQFNGFVPLHYELYQWIDAGMPMGARIERGPTKLVQPRGAFGFRRRAATAPTSQPTTKLSLTGTHPLIAGGVRMTPFVMRLVPALAGTCMVPAIYFLAMQIVNQRAALICAIFTACSAYLLVYSRDAKMYMHFWLCCTLSVACLLWWLRVRTRISWLCWIAASVAMCGLHAPGAVVLGIEMLIFLSHERAWRIPGTILLAGFVIFGTLHGQMKFGATLIDDRWLLAVVTLVLAIVVFAFRNQHEWKVATFYFLGLAIILSGIGGYYLKFNRYKQQIDANDWRRDSGLEWVDRYNRGRTGVDLLRYTGTAYLFGWEWAMPDQEKWIDPRALKLLHGAVYVGVGIALLGLFSNARSRSATTRLSSSKFEIAQPLGVLWVLGWVVVPAYALYCVSMGSESTLLKGVWKPGFASPAVWLQQLSQFFASHRGWIALVACGIAIVFASSAKTVRQRLKKAIGAIAAIAIIYVLCVGIFLLINDLNHRAIMEKGAWHSLWMPRYLGIVFPAFAIALGMLLARLPTRALRYGAVGVIATINLTQFAFRLHESEPPTQLLAGDMLQPAPVRTYLLGSLAEGWGARPGEGLYMSVAWRYYITALSGVKIPPQEFRGDRGRFVTEFKPNTAMRADRIAADAQRSTAINDLIVWDKIERGAIDVNGDDPVKTELGATWRKVSDQTFTAFDHWTWQKLCDVRRREYARVGR